jgi:hypothetical protein
VKGYLEGIIDRSNLQVEKSMAENRGKKASWKIVENRGRQIEKYSW